MTRLGTAVVLAAHGSRSDESVAARIDALAARLQARGVADIVVAAYHAGTPSFETVLDDIDAARIAVVPLFSSDGYYSGVVLPEALRRNARASQPGWRIAQPIGTHPLLASALATVVRDAIADRALSASNCELVVVGHGTTRVAVSQESTDVLARDLSEELAMPATALYLDAEPELGSLWQLTTRPTVIVVPFLFGGGHLRDDLPRRIGVREGRRVEILDGLLALDALDDIVMSRARDALATLGTVTLVGAGPGDPGLITVRGLDALRNADVVIHDRLVAPELLREVRSDVVLIDVGKRAGDEAAAQLRINALLVEHATAGQNVVRLKGGDAFVFGRGSEEVDACAAAGVRCVVVPGVSSAIAAPAAAGIPVTERAVARSFAVVTARTADESPDSNTALGNVAHADTLVIMMGAQAIATVAQQLLDAGRAGDTSVAIVSNGSTAQQRVLSSTLKRVVRDAANTELPAPLVLVVGAVTRRAAITAASPAHADARDSSDTRDGTPTTLQADGTPSGV